MSNWMASLIKLADLEVEQLQKRLREIADRRVAVELVLESLAMEGREETARATLDASAGWYLVGFREGLKARRAKADADLKVCAMEEAGARDALSRAFEEQKKYEMLAETARLTATRKVAKLETAALDELALRGRFRAA
ncbi:flagellar export protein FliJ [Caulobacter sp. S45]|uniref:flagellar export protein FliJ n=1 Tax=Caulobacter sp. S45 TaxID=1641861 RepID=UPI001575C8BE|nr:flagellar export protein FliJ [Caulobacter sp. S45]